MNKATPQAGQPALRVDYLSRAELTARPSDWWHSVLGVVPFGASPEFPAAEDIPLVPVGLTVLGAADSAFEVWQLDEPLRSGRVGHVQYRKGDHVLFGHISLAEADPAIARGDDSARLRQATARAYAEIFAALGKLGYPYLFRVWNYLASINEDNALGERYRQFNTARREAFLRSERVVEGDVPAASALGSGAGSPLVVYFLASPARARPLENPRQLSAYSYPRRYGPDSPIFSRAAIAAATVGQQLFISGTASILGHQSVHIGDAGAQARESAANISALIDAANEGRAGARYSVGALKYKVYVRYASDLAAIQAGFATGLRAEHPITYLQADICRRELLVEIEGVGGPDPGGGAGRA